MVIIGRKYCARLLADLYCLQAGIGIVQALQEIAPDRRQNRQHIGAGEQSWSAAEIQRPSYRDSGNAGKRIRDRSSLNILAAQTRPAKRGALQVQTRASRLKPIK